MSKITNDGLTRSGTRCTHMATVGVEGLTATYCEDTVTYIDRLYADRISSATRHLFLVFFRTLSSSSSFYSPEIHTQWLT